MHKAPSMAFSRKRHTIHHNHVDRTSAVPLQKEQIACERKDFCIRLRLFAPRIMHTYAIRYNNVMYMFSRRHQNQNFLFHVFNSACCVETAKIQTSWKDHPVHIKKNHPGGGGHATKKKNEESKEHSSMLRLRSE